VTGSVWVLSMSQLYRNFGIQFRYPEKWTLNEEEGDEEQVTITVMRDPACFWSLTLLAERPAPEEVLDEALDAYQEEYPDVEVREVKATIARRPAVAIDVDFFCMELCNTAHLRAFQSEQHTLFVMYQVTDHEEGETYPEFDEITKSLEVDLPA